MGLGGGSVRVGVGRGGLGITSNSVPNTRLPIGSYSLRLPFGLYEMSLSIDLY